MNGVQLEHTEFPDLRMTKELKISLNQNTKTFVEEMVGQLGQNFRLREKDKPKDLTASYGFLGVIVAFESECIFAQEMIYAEGRQDLISEEQMEAIKNFYRSDGVLGQLMTEVRQQPDFDIERQTLETDRYQDKLRSGKMAAPITPLSIKSLSCWQAFKESKFEDPQVIIKRHVVAQKTEKE